MRREHTVGCDVEARGVISQEPATLVFETGSLIGLELTNQILGWPDDVNLLVICLSPLLQC